MQDRPSTRAEDVRMRCVSSSRIRIRRWEPTPELAYFNLNVADFVAPSVNFTSSRQQVFACFGVCQL